MEPKVKRTKTPAQALAQLMRLCARAEKSSGDALRLMRTWGLAERDSAEVLRTLTAQKFIDDGRYAAAFVREKSSLNGWGAYKIRAALARKGVAAPLAAQALAQLDRAGTLERLGAQLRRKMRTVKYTTPYDLKTKLMRYGLSLGYPYDEVAETVGGMVKTTDECDGF